MNARTEFWAGVRAELPILVGVIPFGMIYGVLALGAGLSNPEAQAMSAIVFAGSSQFVATQLLGAHAPGLVILLTVAVVNLRHALYSASVAPFLHDLPARWKWLLAYLLTDEAYAVGILRFLRGGESKFQHFYFLGAGLALWSSWQLSTTAGIWLGQVIPASWGLDFTLALTFIALLIPTLKGRPALASAAAAGVVSVLANPLPYKLGLVLAALVGILAGMLTQGDAKGGAA